MRTFIHSALVAIAVLSSVSAASARPVHDQRYQGYSYSGSFDRDHAFWDAQQRNGS